VGSGDDDDDHDDEDWYDVEQPFGRGLITELQRIRRRAGARWILTLGLALLMTGFLVRRVAHKPRIQLAKVVIAVTEGSIAAGHEIAPVRELQDYVNAVLLPDKKLARLIEDEDLFSLRHKMGMPYALGELRDSFEVTVYRNYFLQFAYDAELPRRTARIEIAVSGADGDLAFRIAQRLAAIVIETETEQEDAAAAALARQAEDIAERARADASDLDRQIGTTALALSRARSAHDDGGAQTLRAELSLLAANQHQARIKLAAFEAGVHSDRLRADAIAAGLGLNLKVVSASPPGHDVGQGVRLGLIALVVFALFLPAAAILIGAFDPRIHDRDDVARLGFTPIGHLPGFAGDRIGSLRARGVRRRRTASF
jgi:hypothetical protein